MRHRKITPVACRIIWHSPDRSIWHTDPDPVVNGSCRRRSWTETQAPEALPALMLGCKKTSWNASWALENLGLFENALRYKPIFGLLVCAEYIEHFPSWSSNIRKAT